jgi:sulfite reductase (NADPH) flavoprotein alpha-component
MLRKVLLKIHWVLGISLGVVLALMGLTGSMLSFEEQLLRILNPGVVTVAVQSDQPRLTPQALTERLANAAPGFKMQGLTLFADPTLAPKVTFGATERGGGKPERRRLTRYADPYTGALLSNEALRGEEALHTIEQIHRGMIAGKVGEQLTGAATIALIYLGLSGLYLRWPRNVWRWRSWFQIRWELKGRAFSSALHQVAGTAVLLVYLLSALSGLYFAYDWYRDALTTLSAAKPPSRDAMALERSAGKPALDRVWARFTNLSPNYTTAQITLPRNPKQALEIRYLEGNSPHERAFNRASFQPESGQVLRNLRYDEQSTGTRLLAAMFPLHSGSYFGLGGTLLVMLTSLTMPLFAITGWQLYLARRRQTRKMAAVLGNAPTPAAVEA